MLIRIKTQHKRKNVHAKYVRLVLLIKTNLPNTRKTFTENMYYVALTPLSHPLEFVPVTPAITPTLNLINEPLQ